MKSSEIKKWSAIIGLVILIATMASTGATYWFAPKEFQLQKMIMELSNQVSRLKDIVETHIDSKDIHVNRALIEERIKRLDEKVCEMKVIQDAQTKTLIEINTNVKRLMDQ